MRVPSGYQAGEREGVVYVCRPEASDFLEAALEQYGTLYAFAAARPRNTLQGRTIAYVIEAPGGPWVVRHYVRGGAVAGILGDRYWRLGTPRPLRELWTSAVARARGIATPPVQAIVMHPHGPFYRADIATELVPDAADLAAISVGPQRRPLHERRLAWTAAARVLRSAADAGLFHADLNLRNILIAWRAGLPQAYLLDLDRCRIMRSVGSFDFATMVRRVIRSAHKCERQSGESLQAEIHAFREGLRD